MNNLNWFQARDLAIVGGYAIRPEPEHLWFVHRGGRFIIIEFAADGHEIRREVNGRRAGGSPVIPDFTDAEFGRKDWTTESWTNGTLPACTNPVQPTLLAPSASGGAGAWTFDGRCAGDGNGAGITVADGDAGSAGSEPSPVFLDMTLRGMALPSPDGVVIGTACFTTFPADYTGYADVSIVFPPPQIPLRAYCWIAPAGVDLHVGMVGPYPFPDDAIGVIAGAFGPVRCPALFGSDGITGVGIPAGSGSFLFGHQRSTGVDADNGTGFEHIPQGPEDDYFTRIDVVMLDGSHYSYFEHIGFVGIETSFYGWCPTTVAVTADYSPTADSSYEYDPDLTDDGDEGGDPTPPTSVACWSSVPATIDVTAHVTVTPGVTGVTGTITCTINGVAASPSSITGTSGDFTATIDYTAGLTIHAVADYTQAAGAGPATSGSGSVDVTTPGACPP